MYPEFSDDIRTIQWYEQQIHLYGVQYGEQNLDEFRKYNEAKYRLSIKGLHHGS